MYPKTRVEPSASAQRRARRTSGGAGRPPTPTRARRRRRARSPRNAPTTHLVSAALRGHLARDGLLDDARLLDLAGEREVLLVRDEVVRELAAAQHEEACGGPGPRSVSCCRARELGLRPARPPPRAPGSSRRRSPNAVHDLAREPGRGRRDLPRVALDADAHERVLAEARDVALHRGDGDLAVERPAPEPDRPLDPSLRRARAGDLARGRRVRAEALHLRAATASLAARGRRAPCRARRRRRRARARTRSPRRR